MLLHLKINKYQKIKVPESKLPWPYCIYAEYSTVQTIAVPSTKHERKKLKHSYTSQIFLLRPSVQISLVSLWGNCTFTFLPQFCFLAFKNKNSVPSATAKDQVGCFVAHCKVLHNIFDIHLRNQDLKGKKNLEDDSRDSSERARVQPNSTRGQSQHLLAPQSILEGKSKVLKWTLYIFVCILST